MTLALSVSEVSNLLMTLKLSFTIIIGLIIQATEVKCCLFFDFWRFIYFGKVCHNNLSENTCYNNSIFKCSFSGFCKACWRHTLRLIYTFNRIMQFCMTFSKSKLLAFAYENAGDSSYVHWAQFYKTFTALIY